MHWVSNLKGKRSIKNEILRPELDQDEGIEMEGWCEGSKRAAQCLNYVQDCSPKPLSLCPQVLHTLGHLLGL